jgi:PEP-CTERM motif
MARLLLHPAVAIGTLQSWGKKMLRTMLTGFAIIGALAAGAANAATITFDDIVNPSANTLYTTVSSGGFTFTSNHEHVINSPATCSAGCSGNGSQYLQSESVPYSFTMSQTGGGTFALNAFDSAEGFLALTHLTATRIQVLGNLSGGGTVSISFDLDGIQDGDGGVADFQTFELPSTFADLTSVVFSGFRDTSSSTVAVDNIVVNGTGQPVPEPASLALFAIGLAGLSGMRRQRKSA